MSLLDRRLPVWPWWALALVAGALAGALMLARPDYPARDALVAVSGEIASVRVRDDISNSAAGAAMPAMTSVYFTLRGVEGEFRYPSSHPDYPAVRDATGGALDLLVERAKLGRGEPLVIWEIHERNPFNLTAPPTEVTYDRVVARLEAIDRTLIGGAVALVVLAVALAALGEAIRRRNRRYPAPML